MQAVAGAAEAEVKGQEEGGHESKQGPQDQVTEHRSMLPCAPPDSSDSHLVIPADFFLLSYTYKLFNVYCYGGYFIFPMQGITSTPSW